MNTARSIKLIKNAERKDQHVQIAVELAVQPKRWSSAVRSWVVEFQERDRNDFLPAFDSLFKDALRRSGPGVNPPPVKKGNICI